MGVCVLPDKLALQDTTINVSSQDADGDVIMSQYYFPFSLPFLALCMSRVLNRQPNTHNGKLDMATNNACMIVVKFYCLYRSNSVSSFLTLMSKLGRAHN